MKLPHLTAIFPDVLVWLGGVLVWLGGVNVRKNDAGAGRRIWRRVEQSGRGFGHQLNGVYHASVGPEALGKSHIGKDNIRRGVQGFFDRYPDGRFENLKVVVAGDIGTFEWDFVTTDSSGQKVRNSRLRSSTVR
jgi:hypothetical protein